MLLRARGGRAAARRRVPARARRQPPPPRPASSPRVSLSLSLSRCVSFHTPDVYLFRHLLALGAFGEALRLDARHRPSLANRAFSLRKLGRFREAVVDYTAALCALKADVSRALVLQNVARQPEHRVHDDKENSDALSQGAAVEISFLPEQEAQEHVLALAKLHNARAYCFARCEDFAAAVGDYTRALEIDPRNAHALHNRAISHDRLGNAHRAAQDFAAAGDLQTASRQHQNRTTSTAHPTSKPNANAKDSSKRTKTSKDRPRSTSRKIPTALCSP